MKLSSKLIDERPLILLPSLAKKIGLNEAVFMQQIHFWLLMKKNVKDGYYWTYNTHDEWLEQFPFWSKSTLRRIIDNLIEKDLIVCGRFNKKNYDKTKWYRINYDKLHEVTRDIEVFDGKATVQNEKATVQNEQMDVFNMDTPIPKTNTKTNNKDIKDIVSQDDTYPYERIIDYLNRRVGSKFDWKGKEVQSLIKARFKEGAVAEDFKTVIDKKWKQWHNDAKMVKYLRPKTLFAKSKFNEYLGEAELLIENKPKQQYEKQTALGAMMKMFEGGTNDESYVTTSRNDVRGNVRYLLQSDAE